MPLVARMRHHREISRQSNTTARAADRDRRRRAAIEQRRAATRRTTEHQRRDRRRPWLIAGCAVVLVAVAGGTVAAFLPRDDDTPPPAPLALTSELVEGATAAVTISAPPSAYKVVYRVDTIGDGATTTEEFTVERPFDSRIAAYEGEPPGGDLLWGATSNLGLYSSATSDDEAAAQVAQLAPATALGDFRLDATLTDLATSGTFVAREQRQLLGRTCQVYRTGSALETLQISAPTEQTYTDVCIDEAGLLLEEMNVADGVLASRMIAISVDDQAEIAAGSLAVEGDPLPVDQGGSELVPIDAATAPVAGYWGWATPPAGYEHVGRYLLRDPEDSAVDADQDETGVTTTTAAPPVIHESYVDVYSSGINSIIVRQGPTASQPNLPQGAASNTAGALGAVQTASGLTGSAVFAAPTAPSGWFVVMQATSSRDETVALAATLAPV